MRRTLTSLVAPSLALALLAGSALAQAPPPRLHRRGPAGRLPRANPGQRAACVQRAGPDHPQRHHPDVLRRGRQGRSDRPLGLRPPVRAPDVQGHPRHALGVPGPADRGRRRVQQRLHRRGRHRVPRGRARQPPGAAAVGGGGAAQLAEGGPGQLRLGTPSSGGGAAPAGAGRSLRPAVQLPGAGRLLHRVALQAPGDRQHRRPERRDAGRRAGLPRHLLPARQRQPDRGRQLRPGPARRLGGQILRRHPPSRRADPAHRRQGTAPHRPVERDRLRS